MNINRSIELIEMFKCNLEEIIRLESYEEKKIGSIVFEVKMLFAWIFDYSISKHYVKHIERYFEITKKESNGVFYNRESLSEFIDFLSAVQNHIEEYSKYR
ncbi:hypothetical protein JXR93_11585 [bacterium]|nr:hypothetical protein [bacterium]